MKNYWLLRSRWLVIYGLLPLLTGVGIGVPVWRMHTESAVFIENLRETDGRLLGVVNGGRGPALEVQYFNQAGVAFTKTFPVDDRQAREAEAVGKVSVIHDQRFPDRSELGHIVGENRELLIYRTLLGLCGLLGLWGIGSMFAAARSVSSIGALFRSGQIVQTEVRDAMTAPGRNIGRFTYAFRGPDGRWYEGKSPDLPAARLAAWRPGRPLTVAYDSKNPRRSEPDIFGVLSDARRGDTQAVRG
jgi:hypothetical protein